MTSLVRLEPPYGRGGGWGRQTGTVLPVVRGPRLARTRGMGRWHRPRSGVQFTASAVLGARVCFQLWCGQSVQGADVLTATDVPDGEPLCGTCEGRAVGAGHPPIGVALLVALLHEPMSQYRPPAICPGVKRRLVPDRCGQAVACPACGEVVPVRFRGGYDSTLNLGWHRPSEGLVEPCPFHGWDQLWLPRGESVAVCSCMAEVAA